MENAVAVHDPNTSLALQKVADGLFKSGMFQMPKTLSVLTPLFNMDTNWESRR